MLEEERAFSWRGGGQPEFQDLSSSIAVLLALSRSLCKWDCGWQGAKKARGGDAEGDSSVELQPPNRKADSPRLRPDRVPVPKAPRPTPVALVSAAHARAFILALPFSATTDATMR